MTSTNKYFTNPFVYICVTAFKGYYEITDAAIPTKAQTPLDCFIATDIWYKCHQLSTHSRFINQAHYIKSIFTINDIPTEIDWELRNYGRQPAEKKPGVLCQDEVFAGKENRANTQQCLHTDILQRYAPSLWQFDKTIIQHYTTIYIRVCAFYLLGFGFIAATLTADLCSVRPQNIVNCTKYLYIAILHVWRIKPYLLNVTLFASGII
jgi:hypothetical protein